MTLPPENDPIRTYLARLPEPALPETAWPRLHRRWRGPRSSPWLGPAWLLAAACASAFGLLLALRAPPATGLLPAGHDQAMTTVAPDRVLAQVRAIDRELQAAYARGAPTADTEALWQTREALLTQTANQPPLRPLRI